MPQLPIDDHCRYQTWRAARCRSRTLHEVLIIERDFLIWADGLLLFRPCHPPPAKEPGTDDEQHSDDQDYSHGSEPASVFAAL